MAGGRNSNRLSAANWRLEQQASQKRATSGDIVVYDMVRMIVMGRELSQLELGHEQSDAIVMRLVECS